jgi:hypothetical protein
VDEGAAATPHHGIVTICSDVNGLDPQGFLALTLRPYVPGPTVPLAVRPLVKKTPTREPVTLIAYWVGAGPLSGGSQTTKSVLPIRYARKFSGTSGAPEQAWGIARVTALDGALDPPAFAARTLTV